MTMNYQGGKKAKTAYIQMIKNNYTEEVKFTDYDIIPETAIGFYNSNTKEEIIFNMREIKSVSINHKE